MKTTHRGLPVSQLTEFVGRSAELGELKSLVSSRRLVTITGQAGVGKSRLASRLGEMLRRSFSGSIIFVQMGGVDSASTGEAIADAVGSADISVAATATTLGDRPYLIIIDNLDAPDVAAPMLEELLRGTSETRLLVTTRERTGIRGETPFVLAPLDSPPSNALQGPPDAALDAATGALLLKRINEADPSFRADAVPLEDLLAVCTATDCLPRFIEAAARAVTVLGARSAARAVSESPVVLDEFLPPAIADMTSKRVLDATLERVSAGARQLLGQLSLFESGCDLQFAAQLFGHGRVADIASAASELVDRSLVRSETVGVERRLRVPLHYRVHMLAAMRGETLEAERARQRVALLMRLRHCADSWFSEDQLDSIQFLNRHAADVTSLLSAMSSDPHDAHEALDIISALRYYWQLHPVDPWPRVRDWLGTALSLDTASDVITLRAMQTDAYIAFHEGDVDGARTQLATALDQMSPELTGSPEDLFGVFVEALIELAEGEAASAELKLSRVLSDSLRVELREHLGEKYWYLATCQIALGHEEEALSTLSDGLSYCERVGDVWGRAYMWWLLALVADRQGRSEEAVARVRESVDVMAAFGDRAGLALCVRLLASISTNSGENRNAARLDVLIPRPTYTGPPVPLPELGPLATVETGPPTPLPDNQSLSAMLTRIIDGDVSSATVARNDTTDVLSTREWEIAGLVSEGLSNPAIAARLVLSRRTVEGHVQRILAKLGFRSRSQIAVWMAERNRDAPVSDARVTDSPR